MFFGARHLLNGIFIAWGVKPEKEALGFVDFNLKKGGNSWHATPLPQACLSHNVSHFSSLLFNLGTYLACYCL